MRSVPRVTALAALACAIALPTGFSAASAPAEPRALLPDLIQVVPFDLEVKRHKARGALRWRLGFASAVSNGGDGPLIVEGKRSRGEREMTVSQIVLRSDRKTRLRIHPVGTMRYVAIRTHEHWHYMGFENYELRRAADHALIVPGRKSGFCLGDRYQDLAKLHKPRLPQSKLYLDYCGMHFPKALEGVEGINPGYGDIYHPSIEGQFVDITGVPDGSYELVHRVNMDRKLLESSYDNNVATIRLRITWPNGPLQRPALKWLRSCPDSDVCAPPKPRAAR